MSNIKISQLNPATTLDGTEEIPVVQSGQTVKAPASSFVANALETPKMIADVIINRPIADYTGTIFISTDTYEIYRYNGAAWNLVGSAVFPNFQQVLDQGTYLNMGLYFTNTVTDAVAYILNDNLTTNQNYQLPNSSGTLYLDPGYTPENQSNKSTDVNLGTSNTLYPTQNAVKTYVDANAGGAIQSVKVSFNSAQLQTLTPVNRLQLIPAQGAGTLIRPISFTFKYNYGTVSYLPSTLYVNLNGVGSNMMSSTILNAADSATYWYSVTNGYYQNPFDGSNTALTLSCPGVVAIGDGSLDIYINYEVITL